MIMVYFRTHLNFFSAVELSCLVFWLSELTDKMFVHYIILARLVRYSLQYLRPVILCFLI